MANALSDHQVEQYLRDGYLFPLPAVSRGEIVNLHVKLAELEGREGGKISARTNRKPHLLVPWLNEVIRHPTILDAVEDIIGRTSCAGAPAFSRKPSKTWRWSAGTRIRPIIGACPNPRW